MSLTEQYKLAKIVKRFLDAIWYLIIIAAIAWPVAVMIIGLSMPSEPDQRHADINMYLQFQVSTDLSSDLITETDGQPVLNGHSEVKINNTRSLLAWYLSAFITEIMAVIFLYGLSLMRKVFASIIKGESFVNTNVSLIKQIGVVFIGWHIVHPLLQYFGGRIMLNDIALNIPGIMLYPAFEFNIAGIFAGFAIIVFSGVLSEAVKTHQEQALTI